MKKLNVSLAMLALVLALGLAFVSCDNGSTGGGNSGAASTLTLTDIPAAYNGKYILYNYVGFLDGVQQLYGCNNIAIPAPNSQGIQTQTITLTQINNGRAAIPMWRIQTVTAQGAVTFARFNGNGTANSIDGSVNAFAIFNAPVITISYDPNDPQTIPNSNQEFIARVTFGSITFASGGAAVSVNDGTLYSR